MTTTTDPAAEGKAPAEPAVAQARPRLMQTPAIEPLVVAPEDAALNVVDLIRRSAERNATREAMRWKLPKAQRRGKRGGRLDQPYVSRDLGLGDRAVTRPQGPRHR